MALWETLRGRWKKGKYGKYLIWVFVLGLLLLLLPGGSGEKQSQAAEAAGEISPPEFKLREREEQLAAAVASIAGAGKTRVMLAVSGSVSRELARQEGELYTLSAGGGAQKPVELRFCYPEYLGALVICQGGDDPSVRLAVTRAVQAVTGLGADRITVERLA